MTEKLNLHLNENYCPNCGYVFADEDTEVCPMCGFDYNDIINCPYLEGEKCSVKGCRCRIHGMAYDTCPIFFAMEWHQPI